MAAKPARQPGKTRRDPLEHALQMSCRCCGATFHYVEHRHAGIKTKPRTPAEKATGQLCSSCLFAGCEAGGPCQVAGQRVANPGRRVQVVD